ncbi:MAG: AraC family transcriptional regulator [Cyclobacteriaceae bacterium]|jgi:AraC family transcriptional regulator
MSLSNNLTASLWQKLMPQRADLPSSQPNVYYSVEEYELDYFKSFDPAKSLTKWAAFPVSQTESPGDELGELIIPAGQYAVFRHKGASTDVSNLYQYIFSQWLPQSRYQLAHRPHFAIMDEKYRKDDRNSEEDIYIPID